MSDERKDERRDEREKLLTVLEEAVKEHSRAQDEYLECAAAYMQAETAVRDASVKRDRAADALCEWMANKKKG